MSARASALVLFDIDGTLLRRAGPHHREALEKAIHHATGIETTTDGVPVQGMLDRDIVTMMLERAGASKPFVRRHMPSIVLKAQQIYARSCPDLRSKVCPGARMLLAAGGQSAGMINGGCLEDGDFMLTESLAQNLQPTR